MASHHNLESVQAHLLSPSCEAQQPTDEPRKFGLFHLLDDLKKNLEARPPLPRYNIEMQTLSSRKVSFLSLPGEIRNLIYQQVIRSQPIQIGSRGSDFKCSTSGPTDRCPGSVGRWKYSPSGTRAKTYHGPGCEYPLLYIDHPLVRVNRQIRAETMGLYDQATEIRLKFDHLEDFIHCGLSDLDVQKLLHNRTQIRVTFDIHNLLSHDIPPHFERLLRSWEKRRLHDTSPISRLEILYDIDPNKDYIHRDFRRMLRRIRMLRTLEIYNITGAHCVILYLIHWRKQNIRNITGSTQNKPPGFGEIEQLFDTLQFYVKDHLRHDLWRWWGGSYAVHYIDMWSLPFWYIDFQVHHRGLAAVCPAVDLDSDIAS